MLYELKLIHAEAPTGKFVAFYNDGSGASVFCMTDAGELLNAEGEAYDEAALDNYCQWMPLPDDFRFFFEEKEPVSNPKPDDGWVEWKGEGDFPVKAGSKLEIKCRNGESFIITCNDNDYRFHGIGSPYDVIAYRIIEEKEEKKEPKKQTLLQWISNKYCGKPHPLTEREQFLMGLVSRYGQYLEQR